MSKVSEANRCAVIGNPIGHSLSPEIHNNFAQQFDLSLQYDKQLATEENFNQIVNDFFTGGGTGLNITTPFKEMAFELCESTCALSRVAKSCNTLYLSEGKLLGTTTDSIGWLEDIRRLEFDFTKVRILIIGAGGASRILIHTLLDHFDDLNYSTIVWANRSVDKLAAEVDHQSIMKVGLDEIPPCSFDLVINGISVGWQNEFPALAATLSSQTVMYDLNYGAGAKPFHQWAITRGASMNNCFDGWGMLVNQAAASFAIWWGKQPDTKTLIESGVISTQSS